MKRVKRNALDPQQPILAGQMSRALCSVAVSGRIEVQITRVGLSRNLYI
jgi:hypothetical protein